MFEAKVDLPEWVTIPTSEMGPDFLIGRIIAVWRNYAQVKWWGADGFPHIGIYRISTHTFYEPTDAEWHAYHDRIEGANGS